MSVNGILYSGSRDYQEDEVWKGRNTIRWKQLELRESMLRCYSCVLEASSFSYSEFIIVCAATHLVKDKSVAITLPRYTRCIRYDMIVVEHFFNAFLKAYLFLGNTEQITNLSNFFMTHRSSTFNRFLIF